MLQTDSPPDYALHDTNRQQLIQRVWQASVRWRHECIEEAAKRTAVKGARGLQRTELFCAIGWLLGIPKSVRTIRVSDLIKCCSDPEEKLAVEVFLKWITQCYHLNQATVFGTAINFPVYNLDQDFVVDSLLRSPLDPPPPAQEGFRCEVNLPSMEIMLRTRSSELIAIRSDLGLTYISALRRWQEAPSDKSRDAVTTSLKHYCDQICARFEGGVVQPLIASYGQGTPSLLTSFGDAAVEGSSVLLPWAQVGFFVSFGKFLYSAYQYVRGGEPKTDTVSQSRELEVTLPSGP